MNEDKNKQLFFSLIYSFQMQAMIQLGKLTNPVSNKTEKELDGAQVTIDMLDMLKAKTKNNISNDEIRFLDQVIADLKLNFVEERDKDKSPQTDDMKEKSSTSEKEKEEKSSASKTDEEEKSSDSEKDNKEKSSATEKDSKEKSTTADSENKEKPLTEQIKEDEEKPVPPQE